MKIHWLQYLKNIFRSLKFFGCVHFFNLQHTYSMIILASDSNIQGNDIWYSVFTIRLKVNIVSLNIFMQPVNKSKITPYWNLTIFLVCVFLALNSHSILNSHQIYSIFRFILTDFIVSTCSFSLFFPIIPYQRLVVVQVKLKAIYSNVELISK